MQVLTVAVSNTVAAFSTVLDVRSNDMNSGVSLSLTAAGTTGDIVTVFGTFNSAATDASDANALCVVAGGGVTTLKPGQFIYPYLIVRRDATANNGLSLSVNCEASQGATNPSTLNLPTLAVGNTAAGGDIGGLSAAASVDVYSSFTCNQTTASQTLTLPNPTTAAAGRYVQVANIGSASFTMYGATVNTGAAIRLMWNGTAWAPDRNITNGGNTFGGAMTIGTNDAQAVTLTSGAGITIQGAAAGTISIGTNAVQHDTAIGSATGNSSVTIQGGTNGVAVGNNAIAQPIVIGNVTDTTSVSIRAGTGNIEIGATAQARTTNIATGAAIQAATFGSTTAGSATTVQASGGSLALSAAGAATLTAAAGTNATITTSGAGLVSITGGTGASVFAIGAAGSLALGANATDHTVTVGSTTGASLTTVQGGTNGVAVTGTGAGPIVITGGTGTSSFTTGAAGTLNLGTGAVDTTIALGSGAGVKAVTIGSTNTTSSVTIDSGSGGVAINGTAGGGLTVTAGVTGAVSILSGTTSGGATFGSGAGSSGNVTIQAGATGTLSLVGGTTSGAINIGTAAVERTITLGNVTGATSVVINAGTGNIDIGATAQARIVNVATGNAIQTINIGTNAVPVNVIGIGGAASTIGFFGVAPVGRGAASANANRVVAGATAANTESTYDGGVGGAAFSVGGLVLRLKEIGILAA